MKGPVSCFGETAVLPDQPCKNETVAGALSTFPLLHGQEKCHQGRMGHDKISMIVYDSIVWQPSACKLLLFCVSNFFSQAGD